MALDPQLLRQRHREREQRKKARRKKMLIRIAFAAALLVVCGILIAIFARPDRTGDLSEPSVSTQPTNPTAAPTPTAPKTVIHLAAAGDLNITNAVVAAGGSEQDYTNAFLDVAHLLAGADAAFLNFEGNLCEAPYGDTRSAPQYLVQALANAGVDFLQLANSYSINFGMSGLSTTIDRVRSAGMEPLGVYANQASYNAEKGYTIRDIQGVKVAFVAFTKGMDGLALPVGNENCVNILYSDYSTTYQEINEEKITAVLKAAEKEKPDITVALLHWGSEYNDTVSKSQEEVRDLLLENGVDAIIGTHSHYLQKMEFDPQAGTFVAYSLGDFFGDANGSSAYSVILDLEITKDNTTGETKITGYSYTPIFTVAEKDKPLRVVRIHEAITAYEAYYIDRVSETSYNAMKNALQRIPARIKGE